jgi:CBS domain-containing protein
MKESNVGEMPAVIGGDAVGMLTDRDITVRITANGLDPRKTQVTDAMTEGVVACKEDDDFETVARLMGDKQVRRILIVDEGGKFSGLVSLGDMAIFVDNDLVGDVLRKISLPASPEAK